MSETSVLKSTAWDPAILASSLMANLLSLAVPLAMLQIHDRVIPNEAHETLIVLACIVALALVTDCALRISRARLLAFFSARFEQTAYSRAFWSLLMADAFQHRRLNSGTLAEKMSAVDRLRSQRADGAAAAILDLPFAGLFLAVIAFLSPIVALSLTITLAFSFFMLTRSRKRINAARIDRYEIDARRYSFYKEVLAGMRSVRALGLGDLMARRQERLVGRSAFETREITRSMHRALGLTAAIGNLVPVVAAGAATFMVAAGETSIGVLAAVVLLSGRIVQPVLRVEGSLSTLENSRQLEADLKALTDVPLRQPGHLPLPRVETLRLRNVTTSIDPEFGIALENIDIRLKTGDCLLLQSTDSFRFSMAERLFMGEMPIEAGEIEVNNNALSVFDLKDRQNRIRVLSKEGRLLDGTLYDNVCAFQPDLYRASALKLHADLGLHDVIRQNTRGLQTDVRSDATGLPQSAQRIAANICALVTLPDVVFFHAANAGLDLKNDERMLNWLKQRAAHHILILVTNRPSYMSLATKTLDLSSGLTKTLAGA